MELFVLAFGVWAILVLLAPIGVWRAKERLLLLEARATDLESKLARLGKGQAAAPDPLVGHQAVKPAPAPVPAAVSIPSIVEKSPVVAPAVPVSIPASPAVMAPKDNGIAKQSEPAESQQSWKPKVASPSAPASGTDAFFPDWLIRSLTGGRLFVTLGLILLFIGVGLLFKYVAHYIVFPIEARFICVTLGAMAMITFGHSQMESKRRDYGLYMQGGGLGLLFLTVFSAFKFYSLLSPATAFILLTLIGAATFVLSIRHNAMALSVLAVTGGFLAPLMTSTGQGSHITLFSYYLLINLVIFAIAWIKSWRVLNYIGFGFTFAIGLFWGGQYYVPQFYPSVQAFLIVYFLLYTGIGILFATRAEANLTDPIDAASVLGVPLIGFGLQVALTHYFPHGAMLSAIVLGAFYIMLFMGLRHSQYAGIKVLSSVYKYMALLFLTLAIPFGFSDQTGPLWAMEGVALIFMAQRTRQVGYAYAGMVVLALSNLFMLAIVHTQGVGTPFLNGFYIATLITALSHFAAAYLLASGASPVREGKFFGEVASSAGMVWWIGAGCAEIASVLSPMSPLMACLAYFTASAFLATFVCKQVKVPLIDQLAAVVLPVTMVAAVLQIMQVSSGYHPAMDYGYLGYPIAFAAHYNWMRDKDSHVQPWHHVLAYLTMVLLAGFELGYHVQQLRHTEVEKVCGWLLTASAGILLLVLLEKNRFWPLSVLNEKYQRQVGLPLAAWAFLLCWYTFTQSITAYIPVFNLLDLAELVTITSLIAFYRRTQLLPETKLLLIFVIGALAFAFVNCVMLRIITNHLHIAYLSDEMFMSGVVQTAFTMLWTLIAMTLMLLSSKLSLRMGWVAGAGLLGVVVLKLFVIDLADIGTLSRIVSFMGVGVLTLLLGYISPMPPKNTAQS